MTIGLFLALALPIFALAKLLRQALFPASRSDTMLLVGLATGFSLGITSCFYFAWLSAGAGNAPSFYALIEFVFFAAILCFTGLTQKNVRNNTALDSPAPRRYFLGVFLFVSLAALATIISYCQRTPHGDWDAWAIWNHRARCLFLGGSNWKNAFSTFSSHPDYPLLVPCSVARAWLYATDINIVAPILIGALFTLASVASACGAVSVLVGKNSGLLCAIALASTSHYVLLGGAQYADVPLSFFILATFILFAIDSANTLRYPIYLAGCAAAFAAWTKNEGILFFGVAGFAVCAATTLTDGLRPALAKTFRFLLGAAPVIGVLIYFKLTLAPPNDLVSATDTHDTTKQLFDFSRYAQISYEYIRQLARLGDGSVIALTVFACFVGVSKHRVLKRGFIAPAMTIMLMLAGYFAVYVLTFHNLDWHLESSLDRLFLQLWPTAVFAAFLVIKPVTANHQNQAE